MEENNSESLESLLISLTERQSISKKIKYFEPDKNIPHWPTYSDPAFQEIDGVINKDGYRPFYIDSAAKTKKEDQEFLDLKGYYETFDGLKIEITFSGKYGDPKDHIGLFRPTIKEDSFSSFTLEAKVIGADTWQEKIFSSIVMRDSDLSFHDNLLSLRENESDWRKESNIVLEKIRRIGKMITLYDSVHIKEKMDEISAKLPVFIETLNSMHPKNLSLSRLEIYEYQSQSDMDTFTKIMNDHAFEFNVFTRFSATDARGNNHHVRYEYAIELDSWKIEVDWPLLNRLRYRYRSEKRQNYELEALMLEADIPVPSRLGCDYPVKMQNELRAFMEKIDFIYGALNTTGFCDDPVDNMYIMEFEDALHKARKEISKTNPGYESLVRIAGEGTIWFYSIEYPEEGKLMFNSVDEYILYDIMTSESISHKDWDVKTLMEDKAISTYLDQHPKIQKRVMLFYECYRQDPKNAQDIFSRKDPAFVLALEMDK